LNLLKLFKKIDFIFTFCSLKSWFTDVRVFIRKKALEKLSNNLQCVSAKLNLPMVVRF
jgi:hypothetical protein